MCPSIHTPLHSSLLYTGSGLSPSSTKVTWNQSRIGVRVRRDSPQIHPRSKIFSGRRPPVRLPGVFRTRAARRGHPSPSSVVVAGGRRSAAVPSLLVRRRRADSVESVRLVLSSVASSPPARLHLSQAAVSPPLSRRCSPAVVRRRGPRRSLRQGTSPLLAASSATVRPGDAPGVLYCWYLPALCSVLCSRGDTPHPLSGNRSRSFCCFLLSVQSLQASLWLRILSSVLLLLISLLMVQIIRNGLFVLKLLCGVMIFIPI
jgi:hypothetical protein